MAARLALVGNGKAAVDCLQLLMRPSERPDAARELVLVLADVSNPALGNVLQEVCQELGAPCLATDRVNDPAVVDRLRDVDLVFSVNNFQILREPFLAVPTRGVINFHNAPLPRYAGLNACTWALADGRAEHGVTWHLVDASVDSGDILAQEMFPIPAGATALTLVMDCIRRGAALLARTLDDMVAGTIEPWAQDQAERIFHRRDEIPNQGNVDFAWPFARLDGFVRALNFHPMPNELAHPRAVFQGRSLYLDAVIRAEAGESDLPGTVLAVDNGLTVAVGDGAARVTAVRDQDAKRLPVDQFVSAYGLRPGHVILGGEHA